MEGSFHLNALHIGKGQSAEKTMFRNIERCVCSCSLFYLVKAAHLQRCNDEVVKTVAN